MPKKDSRPKNNYSAEPKPWDKPRDTPKAKPTGHNTGSSHHASAGWLWGYHACQAAWLNPRRSINRLICTDAGAKGFEQAIKDGAKLKRPRLEIVDKTELNKLCGDDAVHQGVAIQAAPLDDAVLDFILENPNTKRIVMLDQVTDPHNVGAIMRSACAFGANAVVVQDRHAPNITGTLAKSASGALDHLPMVRETNLSRAIEKMQEAGFFVIGLDEGGTPLDKLPHYDRLCLVLGAEGAGIRRLVADHCDLLVELPTGGPVPTLNVSNAAAVALFALRAK